MNICINAEVFKKLTEHVPRDRPAYARLEKATKLDGSITKPDEYWIDCSEQEADLYLATARTHFSHLSREIEYAISTAAR